nr:unnamed protein product [Callosobruchus analis]
MAKSVLDLYELYNLVIARGGLVDVINKKLWQEIIKGLHLPSSITSAAFTLRTQYMKYLYPYECEKRRLSTPAELQAAIDGNRREGRRSSYGQYDQMQRSPNPAAGLQMSPLSLVQQQHTQQQLAARMLSLHHQQQQQQQHNGAHHPSHPPPMGQPTANGIQGGPLPGLAPSEFEARMMEYVKLLNKEMRTTAADFAGGGCGTPPPVIRAGGDISPPTIPSSTSPLHPLEMSRMTLWNLYSNNNHPVQPTANANAVEPQKEPINLSEPSNTIKREPECRDSPPAAKRVSKEEEMDDREDEDDEDEEQEHEQDRLQEQQQKPQQLSPSAHIKINSRGDLRNGDNSLVVSMELNGVTYQGVLFAQNPPSRTAMAS